MMSDVVEDKYKPVLSFIGALGLIGRGLAAPPGTPQGAIDVMRTAWEKMITDPSFLADAKKRKLRVIATDAATIEKAVKDSIATANPELVKWAAELAYGKKM